MKNRNEFVHNKTNYMKYSDEPQSDDFDFKKDIMEDHRKIKKSIIAIIERRHF